GTLAPLKTGERGAAAAVPFLLEALQCYGVLERDDWNSTLKGGLLRKQQIEHIRRLAYEELLWLADDVVRRQQEHRSKQELSPEEAGPRGHRVPGKGGDRPLPDASALCAACALPHDPGRRGDGTGR